MFELSFHNGDSSVCNFFLACVMLPCLDVTVTCELMIIPAGVSHVAFSRLTIFIDELNIFNKLDCFFFCGLSNSFLRPLFGLRSKLKPRLLEALFGWLSLTSKA